MFRFIERSRLARAAVAASAARLALVVFLAAVLASPVQAGTSSETNPVVVFSSPGLKEVRLEVCREKAEPRCTSITRIIEVLDPTPTIASVSLLPVLQAEAGLLLHVAGTGGGQPPLSYLWEIVQEGEVVAVLHEAEGWWDTSPHSPGLYEASFHVSNATGIADASAIEITLLPNTPLLFQPVTPCRLFDSRDLFNPVRHEEQRVVQATGRCDIPANARSLSANVTAIGASRAGTVTVMPGNYPILPIATTAFTEGQTRANIAVLLLATDGSGQLVVTADVPSSGAVHVVIDVSGYWVPAPVLPLP